MVLSGADDSDDGDLTLEFHDAARAAPHAYSWQGMVRGLEKREATGGTAAELAAAAEGRAGEGAAASSSCSGGLLATTAGERIFGRGGGAGGAEADEAQRQMLAQHVKRVAAGNTLRVENSRN